MLCAVSFPISRCSVSGPTLTRHQSVQIPEVSFPPARPSLDNLPFLCSYVNSRHRYTHQSFPSSGFGSQIRQADTINRVESWYSGCCQENETQESELTLCCALQAVSQSPCGIKFGLVTCPAWRHGNQSLLALGFSVRTAELAKA